MLFKTKNKIPCFKKSHSTSYVLVVVLPHITSQFIVDFRFGDQLHFIKQ